MPSENSAGNFVLTTLKDTSEIRNMKLHEERTSLAHAETTNAARELIEIFVVKAGQEVHKLKEICCFWSWENSSITSG